MEFSTSQLNVTMCHPQCKCVHNHVTCISTGLSGFPQDLPENTTSITLINSSISTLHAHDVNSLLHLEYLDLKSCGIENMEGAAFNNLPSLVTLNLENNNFTEIVNRTFTDVAVSTLTLRNNSNLSAIHTEAFSHVSINRLDLSNCALSTLPINILRNTINMLGHFILGNNTVPIDIPIGIFTRVDLKLVDLGGNNLESIDFLGGLIAETVILSNNPLGNKVLDLPSSCIIYQLFLDNCNISAIVLTIVLPELRVISMAHNHLTMLRGEVFKNTPFLLTLALPHNSIRYLPSDFADHLSQLENLDLGHNNLLILDGALLGALSLRRLDLSFNSIQTVPQDALPLISRLDSLDLEGNPFHCNCELLPFYNWIRSSGFSRTEVTHSDCASPFPMSLGSMRVNDFLCTPPSVIITHDAARQGQNITFRCRSTSDPAAELRMTTSWGQFVVNDATSDKADLSSQVKLSVPSPDCSFHGSVFCVARNIIGTEEEIINIKTHSRNCTMESGELSNEFSTNTIRHPNHLKSQSTIPQMGLTIEQPQHSGDITKFWLDNETETTPPEILSHRTTFGGPNAGIENIDCRESGFTGHVGMTVICFVILSAIVCLLVVWRCHVNRKRQYTVSPRQTISAKPASVCFVNSAMTPEYTTIS